MAEPEGSQARSAASWAARWLEWSVAGPQRPLTELQMLCSARESIDRAIDLQVRAARRNSATWGDIGRAVGMTRQSARVRWMGKDPRPARPLTEADERSWWKLTDPRWSEPGNGEWLAESRRNLSASS